MTKKNTDCEYTYEFEKLSSQTVQEIKERIEKLKIHLAALEEKYREDNK